MGRIQLFAIVPALPILATDFSVPLPPPSPSPAADGMYQIQALMAAARQ